MPNNTQDLALNTAMFVMLAGLAMFTIHTAAQRAPSETKVIIAPVEDCFETPLPVEPEVVRA